MSDVKLYIYDLSKGLAKSLSPIFLGKQLDGIWHTAIVVYGKEYFFGSDGIQSCHPGGTVLQQPQEVFDLGHTEVPKEVLDELLADMSKDRFAGSKYNLLRHNCNNFSDDLAQFLTGRSIPAHITGLPAEVMSTPFGAQLVPLVDSMQRQLVATQGYHYSAATAGGGSGGSGSSHGGATQPPPPSPSSQLPGPIKFAEPPADFVAAESAIGKEEEEAKDDTIRELQWLDGLGTGATDDGAAATAECRLAGLLRRTAVSGSGPGALASAQTAGRFVQAFERLVGSASGGGGSRQAELAGRVACNAASDLLAAGVPPDRLAACASRLLACGGRPGLPEAGGALALNLLVLRPGNEALAFDLGCLLTDRLQALAVAGAPSAAQLTLARALCAASRDSNQLAQLAAVQGLSLAHLADLCPHVARLHQSVLRAQSMQ